VVVALFVAARPHQGRLIDRRAELGPGAAGLAVGLLASALLIAPTLHGSSTGTTGELLVRLSVAAVGVATLGLLAWVGIRRGSSPATI